MLFIAPFALTVGPLIFGVRNSSGGVSGSYRYTYTMYFFTYGAFRVALFGRVISAIAIMVLLYLMGQAMWTEGQIITHYDGIGTFFWLSWLADEFEEMCSSNVKMEYFTDIRNWSDFSSHALIGFLAILKMRMVASVHDNDAGNVDSDLIQIFRLTLSISILSCTTAAVRWLAYFATLGPLITMVPHLWINKLKEFFDSGVHADHQNDCSRLDKIRNFGLACHVRLCSLAECGAVWGRGRNLCAQAK